MDDKEQIRLLLQALNHLHSEYQALRKAIDQQEDEHLLQQWERHWEQERRQIRLKDACN